MCSDKVELWNWRLSLEKDIKKKTVKEQIFCIICTTNKHKNNYCINSVGGNITEITWCIDMIQVFGKLQFFKSCFT